MTLAALGAGDGVVGPPKLGDDIVLGIPVPEPNEPEQAAPAAPSTIQAAIAGNTRANVIACKVRCRATVLRCG